VHYFDHYTISFQNARSLQHKILLRFKSVSQTKCIALMLSKCYINVRLNRHSGSQLNNHRGIDQASCLSLTVETQDQSQANPCGICGRQGSTETDFTSRTSLYHCHYHSKIAAFSFTRASSTVYYLSNRASLNYTRKTTENILPRLVSTSEG
jgi:hypothetical protein